MHAKAGLFWGVHIFHLFRFADTLHYYPELPKVIVQSCYQSIILTKDIERKQNIRRSQEQ